MFYLDITKIGPIVWITSSIRTLGIRPIYKNSDYFLSHWNWKWLAWIFGCSWYSSRMALPVISDERERTRGSGWCVASTGCVSGMANRIVSASGLLVMASSSLYSLWIMMLIVISGLSHGKTLFWETYFSGFVKLSVSYFPLKYPYDFFFVSE